MWSQQKPWPNYLFQRDAVAVCTFGSRWKEAIKVHGLFLKIYVKHRYENQYMSLTWHSNMITTSNLLQNFNLYSAKP